ncbi:hypothetical protein LguiA_026917 [Lonicera macranthoides]
MIMRTPTPRKRRADSVPLDNSPNSDRRLVIYEDRPVPPESSSPQPSEHLLCTYQCRQMDIYCLVFNICRDCQYLKGIGFGQFEAKPLNPNCLKLKTCNSGEVSVDGRDDQSLEDMMALDTIYCGDYKVDVGDHNSDGGD